MRYRDAVKIGNIFYNCAFDPAVTAGSFFYGGVVMKNRFTEKFRQSGGKAVFADKYVVLPGLCDVHVHLREPGFSYKETVRTGTEAGARGGYTALCSMPNLSPVPDSVDSLRLQTEIIKRDAVIFVYPYGAITVGEKGETLSDMDGLFENVCAFSDDGRGVQNEKTMLAAMEKAKSLGKIIAAHCEVNSLLNGGYIHDGEYAAAHGHRGISSASEYEQIERDLFLAKKTGCAYHVCHISTAESVRLIKKAKADGVDVTCETAPHYLILCDKDLKEEGRFKMNPPLRSEKDKTALIEGIIDGTVDMIATDHAPHSAEEKGLGLEKSLFGITGLETAFPLMFTEFVLTKILTLDKLVCLMSDSPRKRFSLPLRGDDFTVFETETPYLIDPSEFVSMGKSTPFSGRSVFGKCVMTVCDGKTVYNGI